MQNGLYCYPSVRTVELESRIEFGWTFFTELSAGLFRDSVVCPLSPLRIGTNDAIKPSYYDILPGRIDHRLY